MKLKKPIYLILSIVICQLAGILGSFFTITSVESWYSTLNKPFFNPPNWVFGPVWTFLYLLMGISLYLVLLKKADKCFLIVFGLQLLLNSMWSILFFGLQAPLIAFIEILVLWLVILITLLKFYRISKISAYLLIPYILWVSFAAVLNFSIYLLNR